jgi:hypothetical protein
MFWNNRIWNLFIPGMEYSKWYIQIINHHGHPFLENHPQYRQAKGDRHGNGSFDFHCGCGTFECCFAQGVQLNIKPTSGSQRWGTRATTTSLPVD